MSKISDVLTNAVIGNGIKEAIKVKQVPSVHDIWLRIAREASNLSKDNKAKVGALAIRNNRIVSIGVNGYPKGYDDTNINDKHDKVIHAEINAILNYHGSPMDIDTLVIYGLPPCIDCIKMMAAINIEKVVYCINHDIRSWAEWYTQFLNKKHNHPNIKFIEGVLND